MKQGDLCGLLRGTLLYIDETLNTGGLPAITGVADVVTVIRLGVGLGDELAEVMTSRGVRFVYAERLVPWQ